MLWRMSFSVDASAVDGFLTNCNPSLPIRPVPCITTLVDFQGEIHQFGRFLPKERNRTLTIDSDFWSRIKANQRSVSLRSRASLKPAVANCASITGMAFPK